MCTHPLTGRAGERQPDGQINSDLRKAVSSPQMKNISLYQNCEMRYIYRYPVPTRGALAIVTNAGRGAVDAGGALDERHFKRTAKTRGPDVPMLASTVATVQGSPGRARYKP